MRYYVSKTFSTRDPQTGKTLSATAGQKISQTVYNRLSKNIIQRCGIIPARNAPRAGDLSYDQAVFLVTQYIDGQHKDNIISQFHDNFDRPVNGGLECQLRIIAGCDNTTEDTGLDNPGRTLMTAMLHVAPSRFV